MKRRFIFTADDYGVSPIIDKAVQVALRDGLLSSVACFANGTNSEGKFTMKSVRELQDNFKHIDIGCHFTITSGNRMSTMTSDLGKKGKNNHKFRGRAFQHPERALIKDGVDELVDELTAQVAAFTSAGIEIAHFSDHMGILSYTKRGMNAMLEVINAYNSSRTKKATMRNPVFISCVKKLDGTCLEKSTMAKRGALGAAVKSLIQNDKFENIELTAENLNKKLKLVHRKNVQTTDYLIESYYGNPSRKTLKCIQRNAPGDRYFERMLLFENEVASEIMLHLAVESGTDMDKSDYDQAVKELKDHGGVAIKYLKGQRVTEFKKLKNYLKNTFPASELGGFNH